MTRPVRVTDDTVFQQQKTGRLNGTKHIRCVSMLLQSSAAGAVVFYSSISLLLTLILSISILQHSSCLPGIYYIHAQLVYASEIVTADNITYSGIR